MFGQRSAHFPDERNSVKKKVAKKKPGRPSKGGRAYSVKLTDAVVEHYRRLGDGNLTLGIERAVDQSTESGPR
jgi:hypothetical protein